MKTPFYEITPGALLALLATRQLYQADLYTFGLLGGGSLYYTNAQNDITIGGTTWSAGGQSGPFMPGVANRPLIKQSVGLQVANYAFDVVPGAALIGTLTFAQAAQCGIFDGATCLVQRVYAPLTPATLLPVITGGYTVFDGRVAEISPAGRTLCTFNLAGWTELLDIQMPRNLYQPGCLNTLGDTACTINQAAFSESGTVAGVVSGSIFTSTLAGATGTYNFGKILFTSGANAGSSRGIRNYVQGSPGTIACLGPFAAVPSIGDAFTIYKGCDKTYATCFGTFNNLANFRGTPCVPQNSTAV